MIALRFACALAVVGSCWGEAALNPSLYQSLRPTLRHGVFAGVHDDRYDDPRQARYDDDDDRYNNDFSATLYRYRTAPLAFNDHLSAPAYFPNHAPAVPAYNAPAVSSHHARTFPAFNAPAVNSLRGPVVVPSPAIVSLQPPIHHGSVIGAPVIVHKPKVSYVAPVPQPKPVQPIKHQYHVQDELGQYAFGYDAGTSTREESRDAYGNVRGSFSYIDPNGKLNVQHYVAGKDGFRVRGNNLPVHVTNEARHKRSYATFPASTGPLGEPFYDTSYGSYNTPHYVSGVPRQTISYSLQSFPDTTSYGQSYPATASYSPQSFPNTNSYGGQYYPPTTSYSPQSFPNINPYGGQYYPSPPVAPQRGYYY